MHVLPRPVAAGSALLLCLAVACAQAARAPAQGPTAIDVPAVVDDSGATSAGEMPDAGDEAAAAIHALHDDTREVRLDAAEQGPEARISTRLRDETRDTTVVPSSFMSATRRVRAQLRRCYQTALKTNPTVSGKLIVELQLDPSGKVTSATASSRSTLTDATMKSCILDAFRRVTFPPPEDGKPATLTVPVAFVQQGDAAPDGGAPKAP
jgi:TonB family protein